MVLEEDECAPVQPEETFDPADAGESFYMNYDVYTAAWSGSVYADGGDASAFPSTGAALWNGAPGTKSTKMQDKPAPQKEEAHATRAALPATRAALSSERRTESANSEVFDFPVLDMKPKAEPGDDPGVWTVSAPEPWLGYILRREVNVLTLRFSGRVYGLFVRRAPFPVLEIGGVRFGVKAELTLSLAERPLGRKRAASCCAGTSPPAKEKTPSRLYNNLELRSLKRISNFSARIPVRCEDGMVSTRFWSSADEFRFAPKRAIGPRSCPCLAGQPRPGHEATSPNSKQYALSAPRGRAKRASSMEAPDVLSRHATVFDAPRTPSEPGIGLGGHQDRRKASAPEPARVPIFSRVGQGSALQSSGAPCGPEGKPRGFDGPAVFEAHSLCPKCGQPYWHVFRGDLYGLVIEPIP